MLVVILGMPTDSIDPRYCFTRNFKDKNWSAWTDAKHVSVDGKWYADGSRTDGYTGCGFVNSATRTEHIFSRGEFRQYSKLMWLTYWIVHKGVVKNRLVLTWVPGHEGVSSNEEADRLAKEDLAQNLSVELPDESAISP